MNASCSPNCVAGATIGFRQRSASSSLRAKRRSRARRRRSAMPRVVGIELRYPTAKKFSGVTGIISRHLSETTLQRRFAFELLPAEYAAAPNISGDRRQHDCVCAQGCWAVQIPRCREPNGKCVEEYTPCRLGSLCTRRTDVGNGGAPRLRKMHAILACPAVNALH